MTTFQVVLFSLALIGSYLLGAVPFGFLIAKKRGFNIYEHGSGNIGATNVFRVVGKSWGILTSILDILKGFIPAMVIPMVLVFFGMKEYYVPIQLSCGFAAIIGHCWPIYLKFKGGKGVATSAGAMIGLAPLPSLVAFIVWIIVMLLFRFVSLASIMAAIVLAVATWVAFFMDIMRLGTRFDVYIPIVLNLFCLLIILRHKKNIQRLIKGTENRFEKKQ
jgi:acyl phosphate:glycerol-3-phosphate acyltransferase